MNSLQISTGLLVLSGLLGGCANPVASSYVSSGSTVTLAPVADASCVIRETKDLTQEAATLRAQGWTEIGRSSFTDSGKLNFTPVQSQARKVGAALVLWTWWSWEEKFDEAALEPHGQQTVDEDPRQPGVSPNPPKRVSSSPSGPYKVTVYRYEIVFWRKPAG